MMNPFARAAVALTVLGAMTIAAAPMLDNWTGIMQYPVRLSERQIPDMKTGGFLIDLRDDVSPADIADIEAILGASLVPNSSVETANKLMRVQLRPGHGFPDVYKRLHNDPRVEAMEPEVTVSVPGFEMEATAEINSIQQDDFASPFDSFGTRPNDPRYDEQWNFQMVGVEKAWKRTKGKGVVVAVIDTGVSAGNIKKGKPCRDFGLTHMTAGYNFVDKNTDAYDDHGHGTHVAGTIAESTNNKEGVAGLAYEATIMPLKVLNADGSGTAADIADAIRWAADKGANIINMSLGSRFPSDVIHKACQYAQKKGVLIVCAAGNGFQEGVGYPAAFKECMAVSSVGPSKNLAFYSSWGKEVAIAAPGGDMEDGNPANGILQNTNYPESAGGKGDDYYPFQGTSMASPHVAAVAALVMAQGVKDPARVREILQSTAESKGDKKKYGAGILSADSATERAARLNGPRLRNMLIFLVGSLLVVGGFGNRQRKSIALRVLMTGLIGAGFFAPDWFADRVGADSSWNLLTFSALIPTLAFLFAPSAGKWRVPALKIVSALALGVGICLFENAHNGTVPFTTATFGASAESWTMVNMLAAFGLAFIAAWEGRVRAE